MSYLQLLYHIVFRPKASVPAIPIEHEKILYRYIWGYVKEKGGTLYRIGGMPDHIHILVSIPATLSVADFVRDMKVSSSKFIKEHRVEFPKFEGWGKSYCALTHSYLEKDKIINYISNQKEHHKRMNFHDELLSMVREYGVEVDERYFLRE